MTGVKHVATEKWKGKNVSWGKEWQGAGWNTETGRKKK